ncbi:MAG: hypothetical protein J1F35_02100 [Erysipelotrichales bacterium]|nr:hypothetical protein [Erysipelotrichales bacterium]
MKKLEEYELLVSDVFYRCYHILEYIKIKSPLTDLDKEAIMATIMTALVDKELIDPDRDSLDFDNLCIRENYPTGYYYEKHPFVQGFPLWMKEQMRKSVVAISGSMPISVSLSIYAPGQTRCVYDMNTAVSTLFDDFTFYEVDYDSPTRPGKRAEDRPFLEVEIDGVEYLVDTLTKRLFRSDEFKRRYGFEIKDVVRKSEFNKEQRKIYEEQTTVVTDFHSFAIYLHSTEDMRRYSELSPFCAEHNYEIEKAKELYPEVPVLVREIEEAIQRDMKQNPSLYESLKKLILGNNEK